MVKCNDSKYFKRKLLEFMGEEDPLLTMMQWILDQLMLIEAEGKAGAAKGEHSPDRVTHFSGRGVRRFDTRFVVSDAHRGIQAAVLRHFIVA